MTESKKKKVKRESVRISIPTHTRMGFASYRTGKDLGELADEAWSVYDRLVAPKGWESGELNTLDDEALDSLRLKISTFVSDSTENGDIDIAVENVIPKPSRGASEQWQRLQGLLGKILSSKNEIAINAITSNLIAFSDLVRAIPEAVYDPARIAHLHNEMASLQQQVLDSIEEGRDGQTLGKQKPSGGDAADSPDHGKRGPKPRKTAGG